MFLKIVRFTIYSVIMRKIAKLKRKFNNFLFDHYKTRMTLDYIKTFIFCVLAGIIFAIGYSCFILPPENSSSITIVTGGVSGIAQNFLLLFEIANVDVNAALISSIFYFAMNVPIAIFAFFFIGKKFAIFTFINVIATSLFINLLPQIPLFIDISTLLQDNLMDPAALTGNANFGGLILRIMFAAVCTGGSSALAFRTGSSCGGIDVFSYYFSLRKSTGVGKYAIAINAVIVIIHAILLIIQIPNQAYLSIISVLLAITYIFICAIVVDFINVRNKKVQIQIITENESLSTVLISNFTHSATVLKGKGAYSKKDKYTIYMVVPTLESKDVISLARKVDEHAFISVSSLIQVYGNFFIRPVE